jgi:hypothetical protein
MKGAVMRIARRLFVVPLADNDHGKSTMMNVIVSQGLGASSPGVKGRRKLLSPWGREIDAYAFIRSYQETEKNAHGSVVAALDHNDSQWRERELIIFPSHVARSAADIDEMIEAAHVGGFDAICATVIFTGTKGENRAIFSDIWKKHWDERWTVPNPYLHPDDANFRSLFEAQVRALGCDLWTWICRALAS